MPKLKVKVKLK